MDSMKDVVQFVDFGIYCEICKFKDKNEREDPCNDCLAIGARPNSKKPEYYKEKDDI